MLILPGPLKFKWDEGNINKPKKHGLTPEQVEEAFFDQKKVIFEDWKHSNKEQYY